MATQTKNLKKKTPAKKGETKPKKTLPSAAKAKTSTAKKTASVKKTRPVKALSVSKKASAKTTTATAQKAPKSSAVKKTKTEGKTVSKQTTATKKLPAKSASKASAATKSKTFVNSTNKKSTNKKTETAKTESAKAVKSPKPKAAAKKKTTTPTKKTSGAVKAAAARRGDEARPTKEKEEKPVLKEKGATPIKSEAAKKVAKSLIKEKVGKKGTTPKAKPARPIAFTLDEALEIAKSKPAESKENNGNGAGKSGPSAAPAKQKKDVPDDVKQENRVLGAASVSDILGYNPGAGPKKGDDTEIPAKFSRYYKLLLELRDHVVSGLDIHTRETLKRSSKDDNGDLSSYSQHMADAGTDTFDRDFALSLVSSEQDALYEIEDAIRRIKRGSYGICEITGKPIKKERLLAVPFAKYSVEGQIEYERTHRKSAYRGGAFGDSSEDGVQFTDDDSDD